MSKQYFKDYGLGQEIVKALDSLGYENPTEVQTRVIPVALEKQDLVVKSQTGSGKTAAYGIPLCELVDWNEKQTASPDPDPHTGAGPAGQRR